jgi:sirohydrochlorin ferrochelatase
MTVKGQLHACRDSLMAGMRAASRGSSPNPRAEPLLRACLDLVEHLVRQSVDVTTAEVETTLAVLERAFGELEDGTGDATTMNPASVALKNAIGRLKALRLEIAAK